MPGMPDPEMLAQLRAALDGPAQPMPKPQPLPMGGDMAAPPGASGEVTPPVGQSFGPMGGGEVRPPMGESFGPMGGGMAADPGAMDGGPPQTGGQSPQRMALARMLMMQSRGAR